MPVSSTPAKANLANVSNSGGAAPTPITPATKALLHITTNRGGSSAGPFACSRLPADRTTWTAMPPST
ncbi:MAG: hypothetical protein K0R62_7420 [Nonomuraea muscovyensis]|nr:hypothetical protein [Nonomuraea muscovyensis]